MCDNLGISDEKIDVYCVKTLDNEQPFAYDSIDGVMDHIRDDLENMNPSDYPASYIITHMNMRQSDFEKLPEFDG